jgi:hypothetical protein
VAVTGEVHAAGWCRPLHYDSLGLNESYSDTYQPSYRSVFSSAMNTEHPCPARAYPLVVTMELSKLNGAIVFFATI